MLLTEIAGMKVIDKSSSVTSLAGVFNGGVYKYDEFGAPKIQQCSRPA